MLADNDSAKWSYSDHTSFKHKILVRYLQAWLPILSRRNNLAIVDAFTGPGRYTDDSPGSPLLLRDLAARVVGDRNIGQVELHFIEKHPANYSALVSELAAGASPSGIVVMPPVNAMFEEAAPPIIEAVRRSGRYSFWFVDPFGSSGLPMDLLNRILQLRGSEILVTLMVRDIHRFLSVANHQVAYAQLFGLHDDELAVTIERVKRTPDRLGALRDLYVERLESFSDTRLRYVTSVRIDRRGPGDTIYYLVHATGHPKGKQEMKRAIWRITGGLNAYLGAKASSSNPEQLDMFGGGETLVDYDHLKRLLRERFAGLSIKYEALQAAAVEGHTFDAFLDRHIKKALDDMASQGTIRRLRNNVPSVRVLDDGDIVEFPPA